MTQAPNSWSVLTPSTPATVSILADSHGTILLALLAAPIALVGFSLTADLTPDFFDTLRCTQTFAHVPVLALAALTVGSVLVTTRNEPGSILRSRPAKLALVTILLASVLVTTPLSFITLDTAAVPSTTTQEEFAAVAFAATHLDEPWTTDHKRTQIAIHYVDASPAITPTATWLRGGSAPTCSIRSTKTWTTIGGHFFPTAPETIDQQAYQHHLRTSNLVCATTGTNQLILTRPSTADGC